MQALGRTLRKGLQLNARLGENACRVTTSAASESPAASAAPSQKGAVSREFQVSSLDGSTGKGVSQAQVCHQCTVQPVC